MTTKDLIRAEIDNVSEQDLDDLYEMIVAFVKERQRGEGDGLLAALSRIRIDGPEDFSTNLDLYLSGEKRAEPDLR